MPRAARCGTHAGGGDGRRIRAKVFRAINTSAVSLNRRRMAADEFALANRPVAARAGRTADEYDYGTGWSLLADKVGFAVIYPQQQPANNPRNCFSWFLPDDIARGQGEGERVRKRLAQVSGRDRGNSSSLAVRNGAAGGAFSQWPAGVAWLVRSPLKPQPKLGSRL
jgi:hypothetical protein